MKDYLKAIEYICADSAEIKDVAYLRKAIDRIYRLAHCGRGECVHNIWCKEAEETIEAFKEGKLI